MAQKKETEKKDVKVRDLAPKKDAKGGFARRTSLAGNTSADRGGSSLAGGGTSLAGGGTSLEGNTGAS
jgi:uncharacterized membrane protein YgcG